MMRASITAFRVCSNCRGKKEPDAFYVGKQSNICRACNTRRACDWAKRNPDKYSKNQNRYRNLTLYGMTTEQVAEMFARQGGKCEICRLLKPLHVDHDHSTGNVRAGLCFTCNSAIGKFKDSPALLRAAADYVERFTCQPKKP